MVPICNIMFCGFPFLQTNFGISAQVTVDVTVLSSASPGMLSTYVPAHVLDPSSQYTFIVEVRLRWAGGVVMAQSSVKVITAACPAGGEVTVSPSHGIAGLTRWAQGGMYT